MFEKLLAMLEEIKKDADWTLTGDRLLLTINDFEGFDDDGSELAREYVNPEGVEKVLDYLEDKCDEFDEYSYKFDNYIIEIHYTSEEI